MAIVYNHVGGHPAIIVRTYRYRYPEWYHKLCNRNTVTWQYTGRFWFHSDDSTNYK